MKEERQKNRKNPTSKAKVGSEASDNAMRGFEAYMTADDTENLAATERLMEEMLETENLKTALERVIENAGAPGIDKMTSNNSLYTSWRIGKESEPNF